LLAVVGVARCVEAEDTEVVDIIDGVASEELPLGECSPTTATVALLQRLDSG
jgi:hypothetical protein